MSMIATRTPLPVEICVRLHGADAHQGLLVDVVAVVEVPLVEGEALLLGFGRIDVVVPLDVGTEVRELDRLDHVLDGHAGRDADQVRLLRGHRVDRPGGEELMQGPTMSQPSATRTMSSCGTASGTSGPGSMGSMGTGEGVRPSPAPRASPLGGYTPGQKAAQAEAGRRWPNTSGPDGPAMWGSSSARLDADMVCDGAGQARKAYHGHKARGPAREVLGPTVRQGPRSQARLPSHRLPTGPLIRPTPKLTKTSCAGGRLSRVCWGPSGPVGSYFPGRHAAREGSAHRSAAPDPHVQPRTIGPHPARPRPTRS